MMPTMSQLAQISPTFDRVVQPDDLDLNGHMNVVGFFTPLVRTARDELASAGITEQYIDRRRLGVFASEHHLRYLGELRLGQRLTTRARFLERSDKAVHLQCYLTNETAGRLACVLEVVAVHISQETRRPTSIPDDVATALDARVAVSDALDWSVPRELAFRTGSRDSGRTQPV